MVVIFRPCTSAASRRQEQAVSPSIMTVQAPHWPWSQPFLVPVSPTSSRSQSSSVVRGRTTARTASARGVPSRRRPMRLLRSRRSRPLVLPTTMSGHLLPLILLAAVAFLVQHGFNALRLVLNNTFEKG